MDLGEVIDRSAELAHTITNADGAVIELVEESDMVYRAATGIASRQLGMRLARQGSLSGLCVDSGEVLLCEDSEKDPRVNRAACRTLGLRSMIVVPLKYESKSVGVLKVASKQPDAFHANDIQAITLMSEVNAAVMVHAIEHSSQVEESKLLYLRATQDALTGLGNRALFYDRLHQSLAVARRNKQALGIAMMDMDGLKRINDGHGHRAGDAAIRTLAQRLKGAIRESDTAARLGGDEFAVLLPTILDQKTAQQVCKKLAHQVHAPFEFEGESFPLGASVGIAVYPDDGEDVETLISRADERMYAHKRERKQGRED
jgi:diguanylate cyclase (GGDEF)-like protein